MGFKFFKKKVENKDNKDKKDNKVEEIPTSENLEKNLNTLKEIFKDCDDVVYRTFKVGVEQKNKLAVIFIDGLVDKDTIHDNVLRPLMQEARDKEPEKVRKGLFELVKEGNVSVGEIKEISTLKEAVEGVLVGDTVLLVDGYEKIIIIGSRGAPARGIDQSESETLIRGPRDGLVETFKFNTGLIRKRIRDNKLKIKNMQIGDRSKTDIAVLYIEDIANPNLVEEVKRRLKSIKIDAILESSYIEQFIEDKHYTPFPQIESTERPDAVASALYQGRVAIVVDNTPFSLIVPGTLATFMQSPEDYYQRWLISTLTRLVRYLATLISLFAPALYIALTSYHPGLMPTQLALYVAAARVNVPFPAFIEAFIMEITLEFLREAGTRMSGPIGTTISIVGGLVIGQAAVEAGVVSPLMVIIVAVTAIASFIIPNYELAGGFRVLRFGIMVLASILGLYGVMLGFVLIGIHLVNLTSFGVPYMTPFSTLGKVKEDLKDTFIKFPVTKLGNRPKITNLIDEDKFPLNKGKDNGDDKNDRKG